MSGEPRKAFFSSSARLARGGAWRRVGVGRCDPVAEHLHVPAVARARVALVGAQCRAASGQHVRQDLGLEHEGDRPGGRRNVDLDLRVFSQKIGDMNYLRIGSKYGVCCEYGVNMVLGQEVGACSACGGCE